jgi:hypothetical protein
MHTAAREAGEPDGAALAYSVVTLLSHCCYTVVTLLLHCYDTVVTHLLHNCYTLVTYRCQRGR